MKVPINACAVIDLHTVHACPRSASRLSSAFAGVFGAATATQHNGSGLTDKVWSVKELLERAALA